MRRNLVAVLSLCVFFLMLSVGAAQKTTDKAKADASKAANKTVGAANTAVDKITGKIDINNASREDLMKLKGIGPATADKIIAGRPYKAKNELVTRKLVSRNEYAQIRDQIIAHRVKK